MVCPTHHLYFGLLLPIKRWLLIIGISNTLGATLARLSPMVVGLRRGKSDGGAGGSSKF